MSPRARRVLGNLGLAAASTALLFTALEVGWRVAEGRRGGGKEDNVTGRYNAHDPRWGWRKIPGARASYRRREYTVEVTINGQGLRDPERSYQAQPGTFRVFALGDSFIEGYTVPLEQTVTQVLESELKKRGCLAEVLNGGTNGYSTDQEYLFYLDEGARYAPDVVALFFYYNDILFNDVSGYYGRTKPLLEPKDGGLVVANFPVPRAPDRRATLAPEDEERWLRSAFLDWARDRLMRGAPRAYNVLADLGLWDRVEAVPPREEMRVFKRGPTPRMEGAWWRTRLILEALARETRQRGARLVLVYVPAPFEVNDRVWELTQLAYGMDDAGWDRSRVRRALEALGRELGVGVLDLTDALRVRQGALGGPYYTYDRHWNALGHEIAAEELLGFLVKSGWAPACAER